MGVWQYDGGFGTGDDWVAGVRDGMGLMVEEDMHRQIDENSVNGPWTLQTAE